LADDTVLGNTQRPNYKHIAYAIDKYSADPVSDKEELFRRAVLSAATNHTSNGLENMEMYDKGMGNWRLSPSFHNLPNPMTDTQFELGFNDSIMTGNLLRFDERFLVGLGSQMGMDPTQALALGFSVTSSVVTLEKTMAMHELSANDRNKIRGCVKIDDVVSLHERLGKDNKVQEAVRALQATPSVAPDGEADIPRHRGPGM
jgi:hypothetical protein